MKPFENITVLEFSTMITASFAAMMMADQGARVIKSRADGYGRSHAVYRRDKRVVSVRCLPTAIGANNQLRWI